MKGDKMTSLEDAFPDNFVSSGVIFGSGTEYNYVFGDVEVRVFTDLAPAKFGPYAYVPTGKYRLTFSGDDGVYITRSKEQVIEYLRKHYGDRVCHRRT
jgi:hypothetical protein